jgi:hypothetical protein
MAYDHGNAIKMVVGSEEAYMERDGYTWWHRALVLLACVLGIYVRGFGFGFGCRFC